MPAQLVSYNTFGIKANASNLLEIRSVEQLIDALKDKPAINTPYLILGGGSNILFTKDYEGTVLKNNLLGIEIIKEDENHVWIKAASGENWHDLVMHCVHNNWGGIENLSLIPGTVGAAPMQNIGAYGVELSETFVQLEAININSGLTETFNNTQCEFGYRESIFKKEAKGQYFIISVLLKLNKTPKLNTAYGDIETMLKTWGNINPSLSDVSRAIVTIRKTKLPDPAQIGNAGSFFKNSIIEHSHFETLKKTYPDIKSFPVANGKTKIAAAWLIEQAGWKGHRIENVGVHENQALVLVNYGDGTGKELIDLAYKIMDSVKEKFGVILIPEVNII